MVKTPRAGIGQTALDSLGPNDPSRNSVFTRVFVDELTKPLDLAGLAIEVREKVANLALTAKDHFGGFEPHEQTPAYYDQTIGGRIFLTALPAVAPEQPQEDATTIVPRSSDRIPESKSPAQATAQRVVLYEEVPNDPQGRRYVGSAIWRTETVSPGPGFAPEPAVRADVEIPERRITVTWSFRRNTDKAVPASHTIEIMFNLPADFPGGGIATYPAS
jgi:hypothetical protein